MIQRIGENTLHFENGPCLLSWASVAGKKESEGPLGGYFDVCHEDTSLGDKSWEQAESHLQDESINVALQKASLQPEDMDFIFAGDLLNQCISSTFGLRDLQIPFLGQYGACSTMAQALGMASVFVESGAARRAAAVTSSHFCSAERQFRMPLEYGGQRPLTAQWTATASGSILLGKEGNGPIRVREVSFGRITDLGISDANNMGAAMAGAASATIVDFLNDTGKKPEDFDMILTGDLGQVGSDLMQQLLSRENVELGTHYADCGLLIYDRQTQDVHAGGSGCGCSAAVVCSYIMNLLKTGGMKNVLFVGTGALMSPMTVQQGESIPGIAHAVWLKSAY